MDTLELNDRAAGAGTAPADARQAGASEFAVSALMIAKPGIAFGVAAAGFAGMTLAARALPASGTSFLCIMCILMAASGSAMMNVMLEADTDEAMPRVARRSAALALIGEGPALMLSSFMIAISIMLSLLFINVVTGLLILAASFSYIVLYTLSFKRRSPFGTVLGGIPGALPVLIGYAAVKPGLGLDGVILFIVMLMWQPPHFLSLALKYKDEYAAAGLPVMPVVFGAAYTKAVILMYASALPALTLLFRLFGYCSNYFACFAFMLGYFFLGTCYLDVVKTNRYGRAFAVSIVYIMLLLAGVVLDAVIRA